MNFTAMMDCSSPGHHRGHTQAQLHSSQLSKNVSVMAIWFFADQTN